MKKILFVFIFFIGQAGWAQTTISGKREVIGRDIGQIKGIKISGRIID